MIYRRLASLLHFRWLPVLLLFSLPLFGYFGKNKIQYDDLEFLHLETDHFKIYFQKGSEELGAYARDVAENFLSELKTTLKFKFSRKIPIIIYNSTNQFRQTNIILDLLDEGILGFAEIFKFRVVVPFDGSYRHFSSVLRHELTHIFQYEFFFSRRIGSLLTFAPEYFLPLWFLEGLAEYLSKKEVLFNEIVVRDLILTDQFVSLQKLSSDASYRSYRIGESFFRFLEEKYGKEKIFDFLLEVKKKRGIEPAVKKVFGVSFEKLSTSFTEHLKSKYYPLIQKKGNFEKVGRLLTDHKKEKSNYNIAPAPSPSGTKIAYISDKKGVSGIYLLDRASGKSKLLIKGERSKGIEEIPVLKSGICWTKDEENLLFFTIKKSKPVLVLYNLKKRKIIQSIPLPLDAAYAPAISSDNEDVTFIGLKDGYSDLYIFNLKSKEMKRLTADFFEDKDPSFSPDGKSIIFVSDRLILKEDSILLGGYGIFVYERERKEIKKIYPPGNERSDYLSSPKFLDTTQIAFIEGDSSYNIKIYSLLLEKVLKKSDFLGAVFHLNLTKSDLIFSYFSDYGFDVAICENFLTSIPEVEALSIFSPPADSFYYSPKESISAASYSFSLSPDYAVGQAFYSTYGGFAGQVELALSDILGNHRFYILTDLYGLLDLSNFYFSYWYLKGREDYNLTLFQFTDFFSISERKYLVYTRRAIYPLLSYPLNKYERMELGTIFYFRDFRFYERTPLGDFEKAEERISDKNFIFTLGYVFDNALFSYFGPISGARLRIQPYSTLPFSDSNFYSLWSDIRSYYQFIENYVIAFNIGGIFSFGRNREKFILDGGVVRGYEHKDYLEDDTLMPYLLFASGELRFPFIEVLKLGFPLPVTIRNIRGVSFIDWGTVFSNFTFSQIKDHALWGVGFGLRFFVGSFPIKIDFAYPISKKSEKRWEITFGISPDF